VTSDVIKVRSRRAVLPAAAGLLLALATPARASHPYTFQPEPVGNRAVAINWAYCSGSSACWQTDVLDWTGDSRVAAAKSTGYYVTAWNGNFDDKMYVLADVNPVPIGTVAVIGLKPEACDHTPGREWTCYTHTHHYTNNSTYGSCGSGARETNGTDWVDCSVIHVGEGTLNTGPNSVATVLSHEVGHHLYLEDHSGTGTDTIMHSPNTGVMQPTWSDKATAGACRYISYC
jgi:hypothetical protein